MQIVLLADVIPPFERGGGGKIPLHLAGGFQKQGHRVTIISTTPQPSYSETQNDIAVHYIHSRYPMRWRAWMSLSNPQVLGNVRRLLAEIQPDVVNIHNIHSDLSYASIVVASQMGFPVVFSAHDVMTFAYTKLTHFIDPTHCEVQPSDYRLPPLYNLRQNRFRYNPFRNIFIRRVLSRHTQIRVAISQAHRIALEANDLPNFRVVYHGFDSEQYRADQDRINNLQTRLNLAGRRIILFGGRLTTLKGSRQLMEAFNEVVTRIPEALLLVLSATPIDKAWMAGLPTITDHHICEAGWLDPKDLLAAYALADVVAVPSICLDTLPTTAFEGMAAGRPVLGTCYGGTPELVEDGITGFVVNPFDTAVFADRLTQILSDADLRESMGNAGRQRVDEHFNFRQQLDNMLMLYDEAIRLKQEQVKKVKKGER